MPQNQLATDPTGQKIYVSGATPADVSNTITAASLTPSTPIDVGTSPSPTTPGTGGASSTIKTNADVLTQAQLDAQNALLGRTQFNDSGTNALADLNKLSSQNTPTDTNTSLYEQTYGVTPGTAQADRTQALSNFNTSNKAYQDAQDRYNALNAQIQGLDYQANTVIPNQAQQDATGRGITAGGLAPITAAQQRQILLQKAPLQYSALLAQADQASALGKVNLAKGILDQANAHIDELYKAQTTDLANAQNRQNTLIDKAWSYMTTAEQNKATELKAQTASNTNQASAYINDVQAAIKEAAANGNPKLAGQIAKLMTVQLDPTSKTFKADYQKANSDLASLLAQNQAKPKTQIVGDAANGYTQITTDASGKFISTAPVVAGTGGTKTDVGGALSDAQSAIAKGANPDAVKQAFLKDHPDAGTKWDAYFTSASGEANKYPAPPASTTKPWWQFW